MGSHRVNLLRIHFRTGMNAGRVSLELVQADLKQDWDFSWKYNPICPWGTTWEAPFISSWEISLVSEKGSLVDGTLNGPNSESSLGGGNRLAQCDRPNCWFSTGGDFPSPKNGFDWRSNLSLNDPSRSQKTKGFLFDCTDLLPAIACGICSGLNQLFCWTLRFNDYPFQRFFNPKTLRK